MFSPPARVRSAAVTEIEVSDEGAQLYVDTLCRVASTISWDQLEQLEQDGDEAVFNHFDECTMHEIVYSMISFTPFTYTEQDMAEVSCRLCGSEHHNLPNCFLRDRKEKCQFSHWYLARLDQQLIEELLLNATKAGVFKDKPNLANQLREKIAEEKALRKARSDTFRDVKANNFQPRKYPSSGSNGYNDRNH